MARSPRARRARKQHKKKPPNPPRGKGGNRDAINVPEKSRTLQPRRAGGASTGQRTIVFIDYQNMYRSAREAFGWQSEAGHFGSFRPYALGRQLVRDQSRMLTEVRIYTGVHTPHRNAAQHGQMQRRMLAWVAAAPEKVQVFPRSLRYDANGKAREKGVDVELAIDIVSLASDDAFGVLAVASADTDLVPAIQFVADRFPDKEVMTVGYRPLKGCDPPAPLDLPRGGVERRFVTAQDFARIADRTNYYESASDVSAMLDPMRVARIRRRLAA
jgi:uncharacterized LabA/DUF88 family protein